LLSQESRGAGDLALPALPDGQALSGLDSSNLQMSLRPMSRTPQEMEELISDELSGTMLQLSALEHLRSARLPRNILRTEQYQDQIEQFRPELGRIDDKASLLKESLNRDPGYSSSEAEYLRRTDGARVTRESAPAEASSISAVAQATLRGRLRAEHPAMRFETLVSAKAAAGAGQLSKQPRSTSGFASNSAELDKLISTTENKEEVTPTQNIGVSDYQGNRFPDSLISRSTDQRYRTEDYFSQSLRKQTSERRVSPLDELSDTDVSRKRPEVLRDVSARAKAILGEHKSYDSFSEDKFNLYINAAQAYLKQGRYYRAADSFTLASIYKPKDPFAYAGKSHALFAAGEYISSALFLSRALQVMPEYVQRKVDLVDIIGGKDKLEARIADAEERLQISDAPELRFLLAYVYYQMDKLDAAKKAIDAAYKKLPNSKAIGALKKAIDSALAGNQPTIQ